MGFSLNFFGESFRSEARAKYQVSMHFYFRAIVCFQCLAPGRLAPLKRAFVTVRPLLFQHQLSAECRLSGRHCGKSIRQGACGLLGKAELEQVALVS